VNGAQELLPVRIVLAEDGRVTILESEDVLPLDADVHSAPGSSNQDLRGMKLRYQGGDSMSNHKPIFVLLPLLLLRQLNMSDFVIPAKAGIQAGAGCRITSGMTALAYLVAALIFFQWMSSVLQGRSPHSVQ
jgi:hypothetical protein